MFLIPSRRWVDLAGLAPPYGYPFVVFVLFVVGLFGPRLGCAGLFVVFSPAVDLNDLTSALLP